MAELAELENMLKYEVWEPTLDQNGAIYSNMLTKIKYKPNGAMRHSRLTVTTVML